MRKGLLVTFAGLVLAMNLFGIVKHVVNELQELIHGEETTVTVYME